ncbi:MAG: ABC transporter substrate-binding protein [Acidimicrobiia bacterium]|nr:ABC transporter substrate-binding protein [Acidimicrobiia bacterium]
MPRFTIHRRLAAVAVAVIVLAAACTSSSDDEGAATDGATTSAGGADTTAAPASTGAPDGTDAASTTTVGELTASARGVTADTITVGISMLDFAYLVENNFSPQGWGDQQGVWQAFIDDLNARGGINGRTVEPVFTFYNPIGNTEADAACIEMTEDNEAFAVLGGFVGPAEGSNVCIVDAQNTILVGGVQDEERLAVAEAPWLWPGSLRPRRSDVFVKLLLDEGVIDETSRIAIVAGKQAEADLDTLEQVLIDNGVPPVEVILQDATSGDIQNEDANWSVIAEQLEAAEADTIFATGSITSTVRGISNNGLDVQLLALDSDELANLGESVQPEAAEGTITVTGLSGDELWNNPGLEPCIEVFSAAFPDVELKNPSDHVEGDEQWYNPIQSYCTRLALFEMVATEAGVNLTPETFLAAAETFDQFSLPSFPFASMAPGKYDLNDGFRLSVFNAALGDRGLIEPLTELTDTTP